MTPRRAKKISEAYEALGQQLKPYGPMAVASLEDESELSGARYSNLEVCTVTRNVIQQLQGCAKTQ